jgi:hypothetical protein
MAPKKGGKSRPSPTLLDTTRFSMVESLRLDDTMTKSPEWEAALVKEAFLRGGQEMTVVDRVDRRRGGSLRPATGRPTFSLGVEPLTHPPTDPSPIWDSAASVRDMARQELESLPNWVQKSFDSDPSTPKDQIKPRLENYVGMRGVFYQLGYDNPCGDIFEQLTNDGRLLGYPIQCGIHQAFAERVSGLEGLLKRWGGDDLVEETARGIRGVFGFVPRFIAPKAGERSTVFGLSNHALGLAVDIDAAWNPHIKEPEVMAAIRQATGADYGKAFTEMGADVPADGRVVEIFQGAQKASDALQGWLRQYLPVYVEAERRRTARASFSDPVTDSETDRNMRLLKTILKYHKLPQLQSWMEHGVQSIPLALAAGMMELGFRWGNAYSSSKDGMHFELLPCTWRRCSPSCKHKEHILRPNGPPRLLDDVLTAIAP